jgi:hypothetical protein
MKTRFILMTMIALILSAFVGAAMASTTGIHPLIITGAVFTVSQFTLPAGCMAIRFANPAMKERFATSPQQKLLETTGKFGQHNIKKQQGTTRILYDTLPITPTTSELKFFVGSQNRVFPFSNTGSFGNKLEVGEALVISHIYLSNVNIYTGETTLVTISDLQDVDYMGELNIIQGNSQVMKPIPIMSFKEQYNKDSNHALGVVFTFNTLLTLMPLIEYEFDIQMYPGHVAPKSGIDYIRLTIEGVGSIMSPRDNF